MFYPTVAFILGLHDDALANTGGMPGVRSPDALESAVVQMQATWGGIDLYPSIAEKAVALGFSIVQNHPFVDGNKRVAYQAMWAFLAANGYLLNGDVKEKQRVMLGVAASLISRDDFTLCVK